MCVDEALQAVNRKENAKAKSFQQELEQRKHGGSDDRD